MSKIKLVSLSWISDTLNRKSNDEIIIEIESGKKMAIKDILNDLSMHNPLFGEKVFDVQTRKLAAGINILLNGSFILSENGFDLLVNDGDIIMILPMANGG